MNRVIEFLSFFCGRGRWWLRLVPRFLKPIVITGWGAAYVTVALTLMRDPLGDLDLGHVYYSTGTE